MILNGFSLNESEKSFLNMSFERAVTDRLLAISEAESPIKEMIESLSQWDRPVLKTISLNNKGIISHKNKGRF